MDCALSSSLTLSVESQNLNFTKYVVAPAVASRRSFRLKASFDRPAGGASRGSQTPIEPSNAEEKTIAEVSGSVSVTGEVLTNGVLTPPAIYAKASDMGAYKASLPWWKTVLLGAIAGCYVSLGGSLLLTVGPNCMGIGATNPGLQKYIMGAIGFPYALLAILTCGAELFTGNTALVTTAVLEKKATIKQLAKSWTCSYLGNMIGCALGICLFYNTGLMPQFHGSETFALVKTAAPLKETFIKAILANWFVCLAVWQSIAAQSFGGKFIACLGPVSAFVCVGLEHCIANMFFVPLGILAGANVTMKDFLLKNLIPVTLGNIFAGVVLVACVYSLVYGSLGKKFS
jgi:formate/nitrite transporter